MNPVPIVERIYDLVEEKDLSLWDIEAEMLGTVTDRSATRKLAELVHGAEDTEWLMTHLRGSMRNSGSAGAHS